MIEFLVHLPLWALAAFLNLWLMGFVVVALWALRRWVFPRVDRSGDGTLFFTAAVMQSAMVLFGLVAALTAVTVWTRHEGVASVVSTEATAIGGLYRDFGGYPEPRRSELRNTLRGYTEQVIREAWPAHREGRVIRTGVDWMDKLQAQLFTFEPTTEGQKLIHAETLAAFNRLNQARRLRVDAVSTGLSAALWFVLLPGAMGCLTLCLLVHVEDRRLHLWLALGLAGFVAMVLFVIIALDRPFQGPLGLTADSYQLIYDQVMVGSPK